MKKDDWYRQMEGSIYELNTIDIAVKNITTRFEVTGEDSYGIQIINKKLLLKKQLEDAFDILPTDDFNFLMDFYKKGLSPVQMQKKYIMSEATFYRNKRRVIKRLAQILGYI